MRHLVDISVLDEECKSANGPPASAAEPSFVAEVVSASRHFPAGPGRGGCERSTYTRGSLFTIAEKLLRQPPHPRSGSPDACVDLHNQHTRGALPLPSPAGEKCQGRTGGEKVLAADGCSSSQPSREHEAPGAGCWAPVAILLLGPAARPSPGGGGLGGLPEDGKGELPGLGHDPLRPGGLPGAE